MSQLQYPLTDERLARASELVPRRLMNLVNRLARLERGKVYTLVLIMPECGDGEPLWSVQHEGKLENVR